MESNTTYTFKITFTDWSGNTNTFTKRKLTRKNCTPVIERMDSIYSGKTVYLEYSFTRAPLSQERIYLVCSASPDFSSEVRKYLLNSNESQAYFGYEERLKDYSYFKICVYWEKDDDTIYASSARWRKSAAGTLHFWQE
ncbi:MAG: hypothetical protein K5907_04700 [Treponema sp.]|nr:hypothetical protein [Treponema sp.]